MDRGFLFSLSYLTYFTALSGPGNYDPRPVEGFKADPKSSFLGKERFKENEADNQGDQSSPPLPERKLTATKIACATDLQLREMKGIGDTAGLVPETPTPPTTKPKGPASDAGRQFNWTTKRLTTLQHELDYSHRTTKVLQ